jgi:hypothetical protein
MKLPKAFSWFMADIRLSFGVYSKNGTAIFMHRYACGCGHHVGFFASVYKATIPAMIAIKYTVKVA